MGFSTEYLRACIELRPRLSGRKAVLGDWYIDLRDEVLDVVSRASLEEVEFSSGCYAWVPSADQLFDLVDNQIRAEGFDPSRKVQLLMYKPEEGWKFQTRISGCFTIAFAKDSLQSALAKGWLQSAIRV